MKDNSSKYILKIINDVFPGSKLKEGPRIKGWRKAIFNKRPIELSVGKQ